MFLNAFMLMQKTLGLKAEIRIDPTQFRKTIAPAGIIALPLVALDYTLTCLYSINPIVRLILEEIFFLIIYAVSLRIFRIIETGDFELLEKALPNQLE